MTKEYEALEREYRKLAKKADSRLRALESYKHDKYFKPAIQWSYARAQKDIGKWGGNKRFNTKPPENINQLKAKINDIKEFIDSPTSTKTGIRQVYINRANSINQEYGTNFSWKQLATFIESEQWEKLNSQFGSKTAMKMIAKMQKTNEDVIKGINESNSKVKRMEESMVDGAIRKAVKDNRVNIDELYSMIK